MTYNHISLSQKELDKRKMIQTGSEINAQETIICISIEIAHVTLEHFSFLPPAFESGSSNLDYFPLSMISGIFRDYYCGIFGYCSKHYILKKILRVDCPFNLYRKKFYWYMYISDLLQIYYN